MLSAELLKQIKSLQLWAGHLANNTLVGEYSSAFKGVGMEFDEVREYIPGDDIRSIDWNVTARMNQPFIKVFREEREMTLMLMVDVSASQRFGSHERFKHELSTELAAVLAFLAIKNNDKVGLIVFSDHVEHFIPPKKGRAHVWQIIRSVLTHQGKGRKTDLAEAVQAFLRLQKKRSQCFLISDFRMEGFDKSLRYLAKKHELICVATSDQREILLSDSGLVRLVDAETGESMIVDSSDRRFRERLKNIERERLDQLKSFMLRNKIDFFEVTTEENVVDPLMRYLRGRERRLKK